MSIIIGDVLLAETDLSPERATLGGELVDQVVEQSDGSSFLAISGTRNLDLVLSGVFHIADANGTPLEKIQRLEAWRDTYAPVPVAGLPGVATATLRKVQWTPVRATDVEYSLTLFREVTGGATGVSSPTPPPSAQAPTTASQITSPFTANGSAALQKTLSDLQSTLGG